MWKLNYTLLNKWVKMIIKGKLKWKINIPKPMDCSKSSSKRKFTVAKAYIKREARSQVNFTFHVNKLIKWGTRINHVQSQQKKVLKNRKKQQCWFWKVNKTDESFSQTNNKRAKTSKIINKNVAITMSATEIKRVIRNYYE